MTRSVMTPDDRIPVSLLTGFLGSGKTTVLNRLLKTPEFARTAVIINEFGEVGLDHELVEAVAENIVLLESGCVCCTVRGDLISTLVDLLRQRDEGGFPPFDRVIIETTGLADPVPVLASLLVSPELFSQYRIDGIITTVDASTAHATLDRQPEAVKQIAVADSILLTKTDLVDASAAKAVRDRIAGINPGCAIIVTHNGMVTPAHLFNQGQFDPASRSDDVQNWLRAEMYQDAEATPAAPRHADGVKSRSLTIDTPIPMRVFDMWVDALMAMLGPDLLRMKGIVHVEGTPGPFVLHSVQHVFHPPVMLTSWPSQDRTSRIVLIGRNLPDHVVQASLDWLRTTAGKPVKPKRSLFRADRITFPF